MERSDEIKGRFAPSPTGRLHAGNIYAYLMAWLVAKMQDGRIVLRIEDIDSERSSLKYADSLMSDLEMLGLTWDEGPFFQSDRCKIYEDALAELGKSYDIYPCFCSRKDLMASSAPHGSELVYNNRCWNLSDQEVASMIDQRAKEGRGHALRIHVPKKTVSAQDIFQGPISQDLASECGDFVLRRANGDIAYQLAVVVDDAEMNVNSVIRGADLMPSVPRQIFLQEALGFDRPQYGHVPVLVDESGSRISKRSHAASLEEMMQEHKSARGVLGHIALSSGLISRFEEISPDDLLDELDLLDLNSAVGSKRSIIYG